jgi:hypothetical protein
MLFQMAPKVVAQEFVGGSTPRLPNELELRSLFEHAKKQIRQIHVVAHQKIVSPPKSLESLKAEAEVNLQIEPNLSSQEKAELLKETLTNLQQRNSGEIYRRIEEWKFGDLFRVDQMETTNSIQLTNAFQITQCKGTDADGKPVSWTIFHEIKSINIDRRPKSVFGPAKLWDAARMEPSAYFMVFVSMAKNDSLKRANKNNTELIEIDPQKLHKVMEGNHEAVRVTVEDGTLAGKSMSRLSITPQAPFVSQSGDAVLYFTMDAANPKRIYRTYLANKVQKTAQLIERDSFDENDFPRRWVQTVFFPDGKTEKTETVFMTVDLEPDFQNSEVFALPMPADHIISDLSEDGVGKIIQHPRKYELSQRALLPEQARSHPNRIRLTIILALAAISAFFMGLLLKRRNSLIV